MKMKTSAKLKSKIIANKMARKIRGNAKTMGESTVSMKTKIKIKAKTKPDADIKTIKVG